MKKHQFFVSASTALLISLLLAGCTEGTVGNSGSQEAQSTQNSTSETTLTQQPTQADSNSTNPNFALGMMGIAITSSGFQPSSITAPVGTTVKFFNVDDAKHWPASDPHPTHTLCPGFDAKRPLAKRETYQFTFTEAKTCTFHDHLNPSLKGTIIVQ